MAKNGIFEVPRSRRIFPAINFQFSSYPDLFHQRFPFFLDFGPPKSKKIESIRPQGFSEALGPAVVFGKMEKFKAWLQKSSKTLQVAEIYESQMPCPNSQNEKRRAGGGDPP